ncbi:hypothetical protein ETAA8_45450 [Anatilimnocola aggregata]|uniref:Uncharacterized protein n=1 Tax=Anatilimnocola aggregata TaxID=2528021 RepID=A0A517YGS7_9BACT|nr:hypothetical protein ETAA8_45450 [Anatilimnocola aggregata]
MQPTGNSKKKICLIDSVTGKKTEKIWIPLLTRTACCVVACCPAAVWSGTFQHGKACAPLYGV